MFNAVNQPDPVWPAPLLSFLNRSEPIYIHIAAVQPDGIPFACRGYGARVDDDRLWVSILRTQWPRLQPCLEHRPGGLAALLTCGVDNEAYQVKGTFAGARPLTEEEAAHLGRQRASTYVLLPSLAALSEVAAADCQAIGLAVRAVYVQTPGPGAGSALLEREGL